MAAARSSSGGWRDLPLERNSDQGGGRCRGAAVQPPPHAPHPTAAQSCPHGRSSPTPRGGLAVVPELAAIHAGLTAVHMRRRPC